MGNMLMAISFFMVTVNLSAHLYGHFLFTSDSAQGQETSGIPLQRISFPKNVTHPVFN